MRKRFQKGNVRKTHGSWIGRYYDKGERPTVRLGRVSKMTKSEAYAELSKILAPINARIPDVNHDMTFGDFTESVYFPLKKEGWKDSTAITTPDRIRRHLVSSLGTCKLCEITRSDLQAVLKSEAKLSFSTVDHLRWDLVGIFKLAVADRYIRKNPAESDFLVTPRECKKSDQRTMDTEEVNRLIEVVETLGVRERMIVNLALFAGMRPGEIFGLKRGDVMAKFANISRRIYRGVINTPKNDRSRPAGFSPRLVKDVQEWLDTSPKTGPDGWLFPSEKLVTPISPSNIWGRNIRPILKQKGFGWVNFQILRRTNSTLSFESGVDLKVIADQQGHTLDVTADVYTKTSIGRLIEGAETLEAALIN